MQAKATIKSERSCGMQIETTSAFGVSTYLDRPGSTTAQIEESYEELKERIG